MSVRLLDPALGAAGLLLWITVLSLACLLPVETLPLDDWWSDKLLHLAAYAAGGAWIVLHGLGWAGLLLASLLGAQLEVLQGLTGQRSAEWADLLANVSGLASGGVLGLGTRRALVWLAARSR